MNVYERKIQRLKSDIEETRVKLNGLIDQSGSGITEEILYISEELDVLIKDYYHKFIEAKSKLRLSEDTKNAYK